MGIEDNFMFPLDDPPPDMCEGPQGCDLREKENGNITEEECKKCIAEHNAYEHQNNSL